MARKLTLKLIKLGNGRAVYIPAGEFRDAKIGENIIVYTDIKEKSGDNVYTTTHNPSKHKVYTDTNKDTPNVYTDITYEQEEWEQDTGEQTVRAGTVRA